VFTQQQALNSYVKRETKVKVDGKDIMTAGVTSKTLKALSEAAEKVGESVVSVKLKDEFMVDSLLDLKEDEGKFFLKELTK